MMNIYDKINEFEIQVVEQIDFNGNGEELVKYTKPLKGIEGFVVVFNSGHRVKIKAEEYCRIHKIKDKIRYDRHVLALILNNELDDILPDLDQNDYDRMKEYELDFETALAKVIGDFDEKATALINEANGDRKRLAVELLPASGIDKRYWNFVFKAVDGHDMNKIIMSFVQSKLGSNTKYNEAAMLLGLPLHDDKVIEE